MFGLFKKSKIVNKLGDKELIELLSNCGLTLLKEGTDYVSFDGIKCVFGYCVQGVDDDIEALFKIETDKVVAYYQALHGNVTRLNITEDMFHSAIDIFYTNNPKLKKEFASLELRKN